MVGVFFRAPNPGAPAFVDVGDTVVPGQTLCVLEAMKLFNELKSETAGTVCHTHRYAQPVEFGQLLFEIEPIPRRPRSRKAASCSRASSSRIGARLRCE
jgi:biotin carboxyl carrier protein